MEGTREVRGKMRTHFTNFDLSGHHPLAQEKKKYVMLFSLLLFFFIIIPTKTATFPHIETQVNMINT